jgi:hypothetical protein
MLYMLLPAGWMMQIVRPRISTPGATAAPWLSGSPVAQWHRICNFGIASAPQSQRLDLAPYSLPLLAHRSLAL